MDVTQFYTRTSYALRGTDEDAPTHGDDEALYWLDTLNRKKDELYQDVSKNWRNTYYATTPNEPGTVATSGTTTLTGTGTYFNDYRVGDKITVDGETVRTIATITSNTVLTVTVAFSNTVTANTFTHQTIIATGVQTYSLHRSFLSPSNNAFVTDTDDNRLDFAIITPEEQDTVTQEVYISGRDPQTVTFTQEIESTDPMVGGVLTLEGFYLPDDLVNETDTLPFLDANWAVLAVASEVAFNDITYEDKAPDLNAKANALYTQMVKKNRSLVYNQPRVIPTNVYRIRGY